MDGAQDGVAVLYGFGDNAHRQQVINLVHGNALPDQLLVDAVKALIRLSTWLLLRFL